MFAATLKLSHSHRPVNAIVEEVRESLEKIKMRAVNDTASSVTQIFEEEQNKLLVKHKDIDM